MRNNILTISNTKEKCCGCLSCSFACPKQAISFSFDSEGFAYPIVNSGKCIHCGKCLTVCPSFSLKKKEDEPQKNFIVMRRRDTDIWLNSTSGGAYSLICDSLLKKYSDVVFYGASFNNTLEVVHSRSTDYKAFCKSKYVQSHLLDALVLIKEDLESGKFVVFSGTPCQTKAVWLLFNEKFANHLFLIDLVCHGVGSPVIFHDFLKHLEKRYHSKITKYVFREKVATDHEFYDYVSQYTFANGKTIAANRDLYNRCFLKQIINRPSCLGGNCHFKGLSRVSDFTIGDYRNSEIIKQHGFDCVNYNYSLISINSKRASSVIDNLLFDCDHFSISIEDVAKDNPMFFKNDLSPLDRNDFYNYAYKKGFYRALKKYCSGRPILSNLKFKISVSESKRKRRIA